MKKTAGRNANIQENLFFNSLNRFELLSIATKEGIWEYDFKTRQSYYNLGMTDLFGYSQSEMEDNNTWWRSNIHPQEKDDIIGELDELLLGEKTVWWGQYKFLCKSGEYRKVLDRLFVVRDKENKPLKLIGTMQDLTELDALQLQVQNLKIQHRRAMVKAIINSEENERKDISEELHENINQVLATVNLKIANVKHSIKGDEEKGLNEVQELLHYSIKEIRSIARRLSPLTLEALGLQTSLEELSDILKTKKGIDYSISVDEDVSKKTDSSIMRLLYRIAQLQIINIEKHSDAKNICIKIIPFREHISMTIYDDGTGINLKSLKYGRGFSFIEERVEAFEGSFTLKSAEGENGFILIVTI
ncbi:MAG: PAS domain-containing protein [Ginsengibacter sp.]